jgi:hypothetical protein
LYSLPPSPFLHASSTLTFLSPPSMLGRRWCPTTIEQTKLDHIVVGILHSSSMWRFIKHHPHVASSASQSTKVSTCFSTPSLFHDLISYSGSDLFFLECFNFVHVHKLGFDWASCWTISL